MMDDAKVIVTTIPAPEKFTKDNRAALKVELLGAIDGGCSVLVVDFRACRYMDATALGLLVNVHKRASERSAKLVLANLSGDLRTLFELTRLDKLFSIREATP